MGVLNKAFIEQRKQQWPEILDRLKTCNFTRGEQKIFEAYYVRGKEPKWFDSEEAMAEDPIPLVFRLWLHPDQSEESWCAIAERVLGYKGRGFTDISIHDSRKIINECARTHYYNGVDAPSGFFRGAEGRIFNFMFWGNSAGRRYMFNPRPKFPEDNDLPVLPVLFWLLVLCRYELVAWC